MNLRGGTHAGARGTTSEEFHKDSINCWGLRRYLRLYLGGLAGSGKSARLAARLVGVTLKIDSRIIASCLLRAMLTLLDNYLRTYRKRSGLTQTEVAFLLGCGNGAQVSRYEKQHHLPPLRTALACGTIFRVHLPELFAGIQEAVDQEIAGRVETLRGELEHGRNQPKKSLLAERKLAWLNEHHGRVQSSEDIPL